MDCFSDWLTDWLTDWLRQLDLKWKDYCKWLFQAYLGIVFLNKSAWLVEVQV